MLQTRKARNQHQCKSFSEYQQGLELTDEQKAIAKRKQNTEKRPDEALLDAADFIYWAIIFVFSLIAILSLAYTSSAFWGAA